MNNYFCLTSGDVLANFTNTVELIHALLQTRLTCTSIFISLSNMASVFLTLLTGDIFIFPIFIDLVLTFSSDAEVPKIMNSVLLSLSFNMLACIQRSASVQLYRMNF